MDVLKNALKAANHKIEELHAALRAQTALQVALASPRTYLSEEHRIFAILHCTAYKLKIFALPCTPFLNGVRMPDDLTLTKL